MKTKITILAIAMAMFSLNAQSQNWLTAGNTQTTAASAAFRLGYTNAANTNPMRFFTQGAERMRLTNGGLLVVANPLYVPGGACALDVDGNINAQKSYFLGSSRVLFDNGGSSSIYCGIGSGASLAGGTDNAFFGFKSGQQTTTGGQNCFMGSLSGLSNLAGGANTFIGWASGQSNQNGGANTFLGYAAGISNVSGNENVIVGVKAGATNDATGNTFVGAYSGNNNSTGTENVFIGNSAGQSNGVESVNTYVGYYAGLNSKAYKNAFFGTYAGLSNNSGSGNVFLGAGTGNATVNGSTDTYVGYSADASGDFNNSGSFGAFAIANTNDMIRMGNTGITLLECEVNWTVTSDARMKQNIQANVPGLSFIRQLRPVTYNYNMDAMDKLQNSSEEWINSEVRAKAKAQKESIVYTGFLAQEVEQAAKSVDYNFSGVDAPNAQKGYYGLRYSEFVVPLVQAVQEQQTIIDDQNAKIENLSSEIEELKSMMRASGIGNVPATNRIMPVSPNPVKDGVIQIKYEMSSSNEAQIIVTDIKGQVVYNGTATANGQFTIESATLAVGEYFVSMIIDGQKTSSQRFVVVR
jgi:trimeric autotransporter adhesin